MNATPLTFNFELPANVRKMVRPAPAQVHSRTSCEAAKAIEPKAETLRGKVLAYLHWCNGMGATDEQIQTALEMNPSTQ